MEAINIYQKKGLQRVINASGYMTKLGASTIHDEVAKEMKEAAQNYVDMDELMIWAGKEIGRQIGCPDACVTSSASAGITLAVSSLITKDKVTKAENFFSYLNQAEKREVIMLKGHNINFGARIDTLISLGGGKVVEVGSANRSTIDDIKEAVSEKTLAILFVISHHGRLSNNVNDIIRLANSLSTPCIVDAADEDNLQIYSKMGADFVCYSGDKVICGPASGFVVCKNERLADNMRLQYKGIGRSMKVGKENVMGLVKAIDMYQRRVNSNLGDNELEANIKELNQIEGITAVMIQEEANHDIFHVRIKFEKSKYGFTAQEVNVKLQNHDPCIYLRDHDASSGYLSIDPRTLMSSNEWKEIIEILKNLKVGK